MSTKTSLLRNCTQGMNPLYLVGKNIRSRIYDSKYWKEECATLAAEHLVDKAKDLTFIGGVSGEAEDAEPTLFLCLILRMLQIQPKEDIAFEFIRDEQFKYVRALGAFYVRLTGSLVDCTKYLMPLHNDNRILSRQNCHAQFELVHMKDFVGELLKYERVCSVILPSIHNILGRTDKVVITAPEEEMERREKRKRGPSTKNDSNKVTIRKEKRRHPERKAWLKSHDAPVRKHKKLS